MDAFRTKLLDRLKRSEFWHDRVRQTATYISGLCCPECGRREAWAYTASPLAIICNRKNECGARVRTLELFPELLENIERDYAPTQEDPNRPAREYLHSRGLTEKSLKGLRFAYWRKIRKTSSGGVMFYVGTAANGEEIWNGRLFSPPAGESKSHNKGPTAGLHWKHPGREYDPKKPTYATEGVIDALSLWEMGVQAVAVISSGQDPSKVDFEDLQHNLVIAFDPDAAGARGLRKWMACYPKADAATPRNGDWNDFLRGQAPGKAADALKDALPEFRVRARLLLAESPAEYAFTWREFYDCSPGLFAFDQSYYFAGAKADKNGYLPTSRVSNFTLSVDHYQLDTSPEGELVYRYALHVRPKSGRPVSCAIGGSDLSGQWNLRNALLERAKVLWEGDAKPTAALARLVVESGAPEVRQVDILGHDRQSDCCIFQDFLVDPAGKIHLPDKRGFFRVSRLECLRPPAIGSIRPKKGIAADLLYRMLNVAWPENAPLAFAWMVASWFVHVVRPELGFFPFLSLHGDTQTGKTRLVRLLNAMQCLDEEGLPMAKWNTGKGEIRKIAQRSGLFRALLEANREENIRFDLDSILTLYNYGNPLQVRAVKSNDLRVQETAFKSSLVFVQNKEPFRSKAQHERVVSCRPFDAGDITRATTDAFASLTRIPLRELAYIFIDIMSKRRFFQDNWMAAYDTAREEIIREVPDNRIAENHAILLAFHRLVCQVIKVEEYDMFPFLVELASAKHERCSHREPTIADEFWAAVNELEPAAVDRFIERDDGTWKLKSPVAIKVLGDFGYRFNARELHAAFREHPAFQVYKPCRCTFEKVASTLVKVWCFDSTKI